MCIIFHYSFRHEPRPHFQLGDAATLNVVAKKLLQNSQMTSNKSNKHVANFNGGFKECSLFSYHSTQNSIFYFTNGAFQIQWWTIRHISSTIWQCLFVCWVIILPKGAANPSGSHMDRATSTAWCLCVLHHWIGREWRRSSFRHSYHRRITQHMRQPSPCWGYRGRGGLECLSPLL